MKNSFKKLKDAIKLLRDVIRRKNSEINSLKIENEKLNNEISRLKEELNAKPKPPWIKEPANKSAKNKLKKLGPKFKHTPNIKKIPEKVDFEIDLKLDFCPDCSNKVASPSHWHSHYQMDIPDLAPVKTTKFNVGWSYCKNCKKKVSPRNRVSHSLYGSHLHSYVSYWKYGLGLTLGKIKKLLFELYKLDISTGVLSEMITRTSSKLLQNYETLGREIKGEDVIYADETGWRSRADNKWLWSFGNEKISFYRIDKSRSSRVVEQILGEKFSGVLVSDFFGSYNKCKSVKQKCWVHLLREIREIKERKPKSREVRKSAKRLKRLFQRGQVLKQMLESGEEIDKKLSRLKDDALKWSLNKYKDPKLKVLARRVLKYRSELFTFVTSKAEATNNRAERDIRPAVLMRKTSYCNRSKQGEKNQSILMSIIGTSSKQKTSYTNIAKSVLIN